MKLIPALAPSAETVAAAPAALLSEASAGGWWGWGPNAYSITHLQKPSSYEVPSPGGSRIEVSSHVSHGGSNADRRLQYGGVDSSDFHEVYFMLNNFVFY